MPLANIRQVTTTFAIIADPEQVKNADDLTTEDGRKLLIVKGGTSQRLITRILKEFGQRLDRAESKFCMARVVPDRPLRRTVKGYRARP